MLPAVNDFLTRLMAGEPIEFQDTMALINECFDYQPTHFENGSDDDLVVNEAGVNEGSCKIFALASLLCLDQSQTLALFGRYYREDVLGHPEGQDHRNIRSFMIHGWAGIHFKGEALLPKTPLSTVEPG